MNDSTQSLAHSRAQVTQVGVPADSKSPDDAETSLDVSALWETLKRSKWIIIGTCILVTGLTMGITLMMPQIYEASAVVSIDDKAQSEIPRMGFGTQGRDLRAEIGMLENSEELSRRVVASVREVADTTEDVAFTLLRRAEEDSSDETTVGLILQDMANFETNAEQGLITIDVESESPTEAAVIANLFASEYQQFSQEMARTEVTATRKFLEEQLQKRKGELQAIEADWESFARSNSVATDGTDGQNVAQEYADLQSQRAALEFQLEQEERTLEILRNQLEQVQPRLQESVREEQNVQSLRTQIQALEEKAAELKASAEQYYINDPTLRGNESRVPALEDMKRRIEGYESRKAELTEELVEASRESGGIAEGDGTTTSIGKLSTLRSRIQEQEQKVEQIRAQIQGMESRIGSYQGRLADIPRQTVQREQLERRLSQAEEFYKDIATKLQETIVAEESEFGYVKIMRSAVVPVLPASPDPKQNLILGLLLGLGLGVGFGFLYQSMNRYIYSPTDIQDKGYSLVGVIPRMDRELKKSFAGEDRVEVEGRTLSTRLFPLLNPWSPITENYRLIRANLQYSAPSGNGHAEKKNPQLMMISSPEPGDGKTTTAVNLAISTAMSGRSVLLIDADMRRPNAHKLLGSDCEPGLADILGGNRTMDVVQKTIVDGLSLLSAGVPDVPPTELLDSNRMRALLALCSEKYDVIIIDTPPILATSDPVVVAPQCDVVLVVASAEQTDFRALSQVERTLDAVGVPVAGVIFNGYDAERASGGYEYGYGYNYDDHYALSA